MDQQQQHDRGKMNADWGAPEQQRSPTPSDGLNASVFQPQMSQASMNLARDDPGDGMTLDTTSISRATTDSVCSFQSMRDIHKFIREVDGRRYNVQNTIYSLPAGELPSSPPHQHGYSDPLLHTQSPDQSFTTSSLLQMKSSTVACGYTNLVASLLFLTIFRV